MAIQRSGIGESPDFRDLVSGLRACDAAAETALFDYFGPRILMLARREMGSTSAAEDVRSETLLRVLTAVRADRLRDPQALPGFVLQTARHVILETRRRDRRVVSIEEKRLPEPSVAAVEPRDHRAVEALRQALDRLAPRDRAFLRLYYYDDLSREEIARELGIAADRVRLVKSRALQRFRDVYQGLIHPDARRHPTEGTGR